MSKKSCNENPLRKANLINKLFFWWLKDIISYAARNDLKPSNIYDTIPEDLSEPLRITLESAWEREVNMANSKSIKPSLSKIIIKTYYGTFIKFAFLPVCYIIICFSPIEMKCSTVNLQVTVKPELFGMIMAYFNSTSTMLTSEAYLYATISTFLMAVQSVMLRYGHFQLTRLGMHIKIACSSLIYKKITKLRCSLSSDHRSASAISLLSIDVGRFELISCYLIYIIIFPLQLLGVTYLMYFYIGYIASVVGIALMLLQAIPLQMLYYTLTLRWRVKQATNTDKRISLIDEILSGIRLIKMYAWENHFEKCVFLARGLEIDGFLKISYLSSLATTFVNISHRVSSFAVTAICILQYRVIDVAEMLIVRQHFFNLRMSLSLFCFNAVKAITNCRVSIKRIEDFLCLPEVQSSVTVISNEENSAAVMIKNVIAFWLEDKKNETLKNVTVDFLPEKFYAVLGITGCGKSSLLKLILGELEASSGQVSVAGEISYANQEPWLFAASIRENIIFGETYEEERYSSIINACALLEDFSQLPYGDETFVGDRGMSLSGGQCARINLARAVYRKADIYLLDDPLAAVDSRVAKTLRSQCIDGLLKNKTVILITHNVRCLNDNDNIILLESGEIQFKGRFNDFRNFNKYTQILSLKVTNDHECTTKVKNENTINDGKFNTLKNDDSMKPVENLEILAKGTISKSVYVKYVKSGGYVALFIVLTANVLRIISMYGFDFEMTAWTEEKSHILINQTMDSKNILDESGLNLKWIKIEKSILIIGCIIALLFFTSIISDVLNCRFLYDANKNLHNNMFSHLIKISLRFFEINPVGNVIPQLKMMIC